MLCSDVRVQQSQCSRLRNARARWLCVFFCMRACSANLISALFESFSGASKPASVQGASRAWGAGTQRAAGKRFEEHSQLC